MLWTDGESFYHNVMRVFGRRTGAHPDPLLRRFHEAGIYLPDERPDHEAGILPPNGWELTERLPADAEAVRMILRGDFVATDCVSYVLRSS